MLHFQTSAEKRRRGERNRESTGGQWELREYYNIKSPEDKKEQENRLQIMLQRREEEMNKGPTDEMRKGKEDGKWRGKI